MKNRLLSLAFLSCTFLACSQENTKRFTLFDVGISAGIQISPELEFTRDDWKKLLPDAPDPTLTDTGFIYDDHSSTSADRNNISAVNLQFKLNPAAGSKRRGVMLIGFNVTHSGWIDLSSGVHRRNGYVIDTLTSSQTGESSYIGLDTVEGYYANYYAGLVSAGTSFVLSTNTERLVSSYIGAQLQLGFSFARGAEYGYRKSVEPWSTNRCMHSIGGDSEESSVTSTTPKMVTRIGALIPFGLTFRLGKKHLASHLSITWENSVGIQRTKIPELRTFGNYSFSTGLRLNYRI